jgi:hypothetical protein
VCNVDKRLCFRTVIVSSTLLKPHEAAYGKKVR